MLPDLLLFNTHIRFVFLIGDIKRRVMRYAGGGWRRSNVRSSAHLFNRHNRLACLISFRLLVFFSFHLFFPFFSSFLRLLFPFFFLFFDHFCNRRNSWSIFFSLCFSLSSVCFPFCSSFLHHFSLFFPLFAHLFNRRNRIFVYDQLLHNRIFLSSVFFLFISFSSFLCLFFPFLSSFLLAFSIDVSVQRMLILLFFVSSSLPSFFPFPGVSFIYYLLLSSFHFPF